MPKRPTPLIALLLTLLLAPALGGAAQASPETDPWADFIGDAEFEHADAGRRAAEFLAAHRPERDAHIDPVILAENLRYAMAARAEFPWARALSEEMFHNDVLPYASLDETRESWRPDFYERCRDIVAGAATATEAAQAINQHLFNEINVHYNTGRKLPNQSPSESIAQGRATCTGLSIILVNACRAVGVPARIAGVANWADKRGNHTWVEIWDDGWHFTGADEFNKHGLNRAWFVRDAGRAVPGSEEHAVWATSWRPTGDHFPMVWDRADRAVPAVDVTARYLPRHSADTENPGVFVRVWDTRGGRRVPADVTAIGPDGSVVAEVTTKHGRADLNDMVTVPVHAEGATTLRVRSSDLERSGFLPAAGSGPGTVDLFLDELGLPRDEAEALLEQRWRARVAAVGAERRAELEAMAFTAGGHTLRIKERTFGDAPEGERSLWISMHGGGGAPARVNDQQWENQIRLYQPEEGIYIAPRAPTDTWNLWHRAHIDTLFDRLIETYVAERGVDPDRVYLMGYSAGGDGVYQLAPRMADRFAAAAMMAGHPNETKPLGLRNLPFALLMGGEDSAYNRNTVAQRWGDELGALQAADPGGYPHQVKIYEGLGHWMERRDAEVLPWMHDQTRDAWPGRVVWHQDDVTHTRFYWLGTDEPRARTTIEASIDGQTIDVRTDDVARFTLRLRDALVDLDRPVTVRVNGEALFEGTVLRTADAIERSLGERLDRESAATASIDLVVP